jgi:hypothetical protein
MAIKSRLMRYVAMKKSLYARQRRGLVLMTAGPPLLLVEPQGRAGAFVFRHGSGAAVTYDRA